MPCAPLIGRKIYRATIMSAAERPTGEPATAVDLAAQALSPEMAQLVDVAQPAVEVPVVRTLPPEDLLDGVKIRLRPPRRPFASAPKAPKAAKVTKAQKVQKAEKTSEAPKAPQPAPLPKRRPEDATVTVPQPNAVPSPSNSLSAAPNGILVGPKLSRSTQRMLRKTKKRRQPTRAELINAESRLGSTIFGPIPEGHRREFFHDQQNIWIWHENWTDAQNHARQMTVRYEVRPSGVYKKLAAGKYIKLEADELENFRRATHVYLYTIKRNLYDRS